MHLGIIDAFQLLAVIIYYYELLQIYFGAAIIGDDRPDHKEIQKDNVMKYAPFWQKLACLLGLESHEIEIIVLNNEYKANKTEASFTAVLKKWLDNGESPTWGTLESAIMQLSNKGQLYYTSGMHLWKSS